MVDSIFNVNENQPDNCSVFTPKAGYGADTIVSFVRSTLRVNTTLAQPRLNSSGETGLSFVTIGAWPGSVQPTGGTYVRMIQGTLVQINFKMYITGEADIREGDRCTLDNRRLEVVNAQHWGSEQTELELKYLGR